ncbi:unnamed protein product [Darwinula stevensoni]|uniref:Uncharacterized protein n=1 Tax=Darwinula stevensoni TaxID=69355 RepID=A0A7R8XD42_9CRUS|nr:unnamed protein product [Darwinula stevensoni]CAG0894324.1 unnamed protein product [Darwinula stevensoni]
MTLATSTTTVTKAPEAGPDLAGSEPLHPYNTRRRTKRVAFNRVVDIRLYVVPDTNANNIPHHQRRHCNYPLGLRLNRKQLRGLTQTVLPSNIIQVQPPCIPMDDKSVEIGQPEAGNEEEMCGRRRKETEVILNRLASVHPSFFECHRFLMRGDGPLPFHYRNYLALLAVGTGGGGGEEYFCLEGQEGEWMKKVPSMGDLPPKLRPLAHFNHLLSHAPWTLQESIKELIRVSWTLSELVQGVVIMCHFHALSSLASPALFLLQDARRGSSDEDKENRSRQKRISGMQVFQPESRPEPASFDNESCPTSFRIQEYSWEEHGFSMASRLYSDVGPYLDDRFCHALAFQRKDPFLTAIWNLTLDLFHIRLDDYDYKEIDTCLTERMQRFIKKAALCPKDLQPEDLHDIGLEELKVNPDQLPRIHFALQQMKVLLIIMEARLQAELLHALRAITAFTT